ncbi:MAG: type ISP restriction/modification enzyme [Promethearchaeota archaeon]
MNFFRDYAQFGHNLTHQFDKMLQNASIENVRELLPFPELDQIPSDTLPELLSQSILFLNLYNTVKLSQPSPVSQRFLHKLYAHPLFREDTTLLKILSNISQYLALQDHRKLFETWHPLSRINFLHQTYPLFIAQYRKSQQKKHGIIYTPEAVTRFMVHACDYLLRENLHHLEGFQSPTVFVYDPAVGSLSFEMELGKLIPSQYWDQFFTRFYGNELNIPAYCIGRFFFTDEHPMKGVATDQVQKPLNIEFVSALTPSFLKLMQSKQVADATTLVVLGNPPYAVSSSNKSPWIITLMKEYAVTEPNLTRLYDDYVKFIRYGQWLLDHQGRGILAYITNRKFLDGKIFHGMRRSLLRSFSDIWIIDLHGDQRNVKDITAHIPQTNIFGIQTGVCILLCVKHLKKKKKESGTLHYTSLTGDRSQVLEGLTQPLLDLHFETWSPTKPRWMFLPIYLSEKLTQLWDQRGIPITECFCKTSRAMISSRDRFMIHVDEEVLRQNISLLKQRDFSQLRQLGRLKKMSDALLENPKLLETFDFQAMDRSITPILYRPFDQRYAIFYTINRRCGKSVILNHLMPTAEKPQNSDNSREFFNSAIQSHGIAFNFIQSMQFPPFCHCMLSTGIVDSGLFGYSTSKVAPLWIEGKSNIHPTFLHQIQAMCPEATPADIFGYMYAILNCREYARMFEPRLLHEFPRILLPLTAEFFTQLASLGLQLMDFHVRPPVKQSFKRVNAPLRSWTYEATDETLHLTFVLTSPEFENRSNKKTEIFVISCPQDVWAFRYGSIQIIKHWIQARLFRKLDRAWSSREWEEISALLYIIPRTITLKKEIGIIYRRHINF